MQSEDNKIILFIDQGTAHRNVALKKVRQVSGLRLTEIQSLRMAYR